MSKYTTEVRFICEENAGLLESVGYSNINKVIDKSMDKIFDFDYPIFDKTYKPILQHKILKHYYTREIGLETVGLWKHFLDMRMNEIMPYYNKLYESELFKFNPLYDVDLTRDHTTTGTETGDKNENSELSNTTNENTNLTERNTNEKINTISNTKSTDETGTIEDEGGKTNTKTLNTTTTSTDSGTDSKSGSDVKKNNRWDIYSDTPQGSLQNIKTGDGAYLTNARNITDDGTGSTFSETINHGKINTTRETGTVGDVETNANTRTLDTNSATTETGRNTETLTGNSTKTGTNKETSDTNTNTNTTHTINTTEDYIEHVVGKTPGASFARLLMEYRDALLNIDMMIIQELSDLFLNLW